MAQVFLHGPKQANCLNYSIQILRSASAQLNLFVQALLKYDTIARDFKELALSEYGRVGKATMLYQVRTTVPAACPPHAYL